MLWVVNSCGFDFSGWGGLIVVFELRGIGGYDYGFLVTLAVR